MRGYVGLLEEIDCHLGHVDVLDLIRATIESVSDVFKSHLNFALGNWRIDHICECKLIKIRRQRRLVEMFTVTRRLFVIKGVKVLKRLIFILLMLSL